MNSCGASDTYDELIRPEKGVRLGIMPVGGEPVELRITSTQFIESTQRPNDNPKYYCLMHTVSVSALISAKGERWESRSGPFGTQGGGGDTLPAEDFARLEKLMNSLPNDARRVPPLDDRILVQVDLAGIATARLYDRRKLPDEVIELIRLTRCRIPIPLLVIDPTRTLTEGEAKRLGLPEPEKEGPHISPDGSICVADDFVTKTLTVYEGGIWQQSCYSSGGRIAHVIQEFWQPDEYGGYLLNEEFSPDGRYLLVSWGNRVGALLYDTSTGQPVSDPHLFPQNLKEYLHTPDWDLGIAVTDKGETLIWNQRQRRVLSMLPGLGDFEAPPVFHDQQGRLAYTTPRAEIRSAEFSPDRARVAIYSGTDETAKLRLSIWDVASGQKLRDLWPITWMSYASGMPLWWGNGRWLIAPFAGQFTQGGSGLWDAQTGRFVGAFGAGSPPCDTREAPTVYGDQLFQRCFMGKGKEDKVLEWSMEAVQRQITNWQSERASIP